MQNKPFPLSPKVCFFAGLVIPILFSGSLTPPSAEAQTITYALFASVLSGIAAVVGFFYLFQRRREALFPVFCAFVGNVLGLTAAALFQGFDAAFVLVRMIFMFVFIGVAYQYFANKIKKG